VGCSFDAGVMTEAPASAFAASQALTRRLSYRHYGGDSRASDVARGMAWWKHRTAMNASDPLGAGAEPPAKRPRRPRYRGTHPREFRDKYKEHDLDAHPEIGLHLRAKGKTPAGSHVSVMTREVLACLHPTPGEIVVDCTLGYGGHAREFAQRITPGGRLIAFDVDRVELERTQARLADLSVSASFHRSNFAGLANVLAKEGLDACDIIFADLGVSSMQIDNPDRGMSYKRDGPLDLRMDDRLQRTGADLLESLGEEDLAQALHDLADEPDAEVVARAIVAARERSPIARTSQLVELILAAKGLTASDWQKRRVSRPDLLHPAARTFQALRMLVNDELACLKQLVRLAPYCLRPGGRIGIISFHSGEDRLVKQSFREGLRKDLYRAVAEEVMVPQREEIASNPRSASAKFRWAATNT
jgi:16S rRNA (cytosine1402-N4)-methyltransferase